MDCDLELLSSEIDVPKHHTEVKNPTYSSPLIIDGGFESDNMGLENTWYVLTF